MPMIHRNPTVNVACLMLVCMLAALRGTAAAQEADREDLKVSRVAVFSSGVACFECSSTVNGTAVTELKFRTDQINDILKSLVVRDFDGGAISAVAYPSRDPISKTLKSFGVNITANPNMAQLLDQLRGEPVTIEGDKSLNGVIIGVEKQRVSVEKEVIDVDVINILADSGMHQLRLSQIRGIKLTNEKVNGELRKALATLATGHDSDKKTVTLRFDGQGRRRVRATYLLEAPIWKTSYRLELLDEKKPFLQGWATVENATEEDWRDVRLSLVSGRPISFTMDLYSPLYVPRPREELELYASLRPPTFEADMALKDAGGERRKMRAAGRADMPAPAAPARGGLVGGGSTYGQTGRPDFDGEQMDKAESEAGLAGQGVSSVAAAQDAGELFEYVIQNPVSISRQQAAMLPIVNEEVAGEKVSIFNPATHGKYPLNGLQFENKTALNLMQGPVTIFDGGVYAGDAKLPDLKPGEKRLIAYALDLAVEMATEFKPRPDELVRLRVNKGVLIRTHKYIDDRLYKARNKGRKDRVVLIEQAITSEWNLTAPKEPAEKTASLSRFKLNVPAQGTAELNVRLERMGDQTIMLSSIGLDEAGMYMRGGVITPAVKAAIEQVMSLRRLADEATRDRAAGETNLNECVQEQARVRENLKTLREKGDAYQRQLNKLDALETRIESLREDLEAKRKDERARAAAVESYLANLDAE